MYEYYIESFVSYGNKSSPFSKALWDSTGGIITDFILILYKLSAINLGHKNS